jgi:hypothetical protein
MQINAALCLPFLSFVAIGSFSAVSPTKAEYLQKSDQASDKTREILYHRITLDKGIQAGTLLKDALEFLADRYHLEIRIDESAFQRLGRSNPAKSKVEARPPLVDVSLSAVLQIVLEHVDADLEIRKGVVWIVPLPSLAAWPHDSGRHSRASGSN